MAILKTEGLTYTYSAGTPFEKTAVDHVDLSIEDHTMVGVIGDVCLIVAAFLCAMYTLSISIRAFFPVRGTDRYPYGLKEAGWRMLVPIGFFAFLNILFGVWSGPVMDFISRISAGII